MIQNSKCTSKDVNCNVFAYSNNGQLFAYCDNQVTRVFEIATNKEILCVNLKRTRKLFFSPKDNFLFTFEPWVIYGAKTDPNQKPAPNVRIYNLTDGRLITTLSSPKESSWEPQFNADESLAARMVGSEIFFYTDMSFDRYDHKLMEKGATNFSLSPGSGPNHVAVYVPAIGSAPARVRVHRVSKSFPVVANRTFYKSDKATITWNQKGNALLILASVDVDKTNQSYYGEQSVSL
uniref:Eukaryotic translation initiation factor 2A n=1 Tax=Caenorhabditis japonica TaxID=281687 RepID=A0A8R1HUK1_CAEJA